MSHCCFFQAEDGIRDLVRSRGLGDVYKRQDQGSQPRRGLQGRPGSATRSKRWRMPRVSESSRPCLLYTSDAADDLLCVDLGGRRIIKKKKNNKIHFHLATTADGR